MKIYIKIVSFKTNGRRVFLSVVVHGTRCRFFPRPETCFSFFFLPFLFCHAVSSSFFLHPDTTESSLLSRSPLWFLATYYFSFSSLPLGPCSHIGEAKPFLPSCSVIHDLLSTSFIPLPFLQLSVCLCYGRNCSSSGVGRKWGGRNRSNQIDRVCYTSHSVGVSVNGPVSVEAHGSGELSTILCF